MKKKVISIMLVGAMIASMGAMAGCGSSDGGSTDDGSVSAADDSSSGDSDHTLTVMAWDASFNIPALEAAAEDYRENVDPDFELEILEQSSSEDIETLLTNVGSDASGSSVSEPPDITLFQDHYFKQYYEMYPDLWLDDLNDADVTWDDFSAEKLDYSTVDGVHYGMPVDGGTVIAAYRTDLLAEAGYTIDDLTQCSWAEFLDIGEAVYNATGKYLLSINADGNDLVYIMMQAEGESQFENGEPNLVDNETLTEIMNVLVEAVERNVLYLANNWDDYTNQVIQGDMVAGIINGNWIIPTMELVEENSGLWEITTLPTLEGGVDGYASNGGSSLYITANCQNTELAVDFLSYTFGGSQETYDNALLYGGVITTNSTCGESDVYSEGVDFFNDQPIYQEIAEWTASVPVIEQSDYHYSCREQIGNALINITQNGYDVETALEEAETNLRFTMGLD